MSTWDEVLPIIVRHLINDLNRDNYKYDNCRVKQAIVIAALLTTQDFTYSQTYTFNIIDPSISPDPVAPATYDAEAISLFTLRAACMLDTNKYQDGLNNGIGIRVKDGDSEIDTREQAKSFQDILSIHSGPCGTYAALVKDKEFKNSMNRGAAIVSPFTHEDYSYSGLTFGSSVVGFFDNYCRSMR
jgi:hypothetical protein